MEGHEEDRPEQKQMSRREETRFKFQVFAITNFPFPSDNLHLLPAMTSRMSLRPKATTQVVPDSLLKTTRAEQHAKKDEETAKKNAAAQQVIQKKSASAKRVAEQMDKQSREDLNSHTHSLRPDLLSSEKNSPLTVIPKNKPSNGKKAKGGAARAQTAKPGKITHPSAAGSELIDVNNVSSNQSTLEESDLPDQGILESDIDSPQAETDKPITGHAGVSSDSDSDAEEIRKLEEALAEKA